MVWHDAEQKYCKSVARLKKPIRKKTPSNYKECKLHGKASAFKKSYYLTFTATCNFAVFLEGPEASYVTPSTSTDIVNIGACTGPV